MEESSHRIPPVRELIDTDLPAPELERLERVDALLRATRPRLRLVATHDEQTQQLKLTHRELSLIYRSLQAAKTLGAVPTENELLDDTIQLVDQALRGAI
jgi:hypothetical protein